jgi:hypothetical protein
MKKQFIWALCCLWSITAYSQKATFNDFFFIRSACGYKYLTVQNASGNAGSPIVLSDYNGSLAQQWKFVQAGNDDHIFYITSALPGGKVLDVIWGKDADGTRVQLWNKMDAAAQKWQLILTDESKGLEGKHMIQTQIGLGVNNTFKNLDKGGGPCTNGTPIMIWTRNQTAAQMWYFEKVGGSATDGGGTDSRKIVGDWTLYPGVANDVAVGGPSNEVFVIGWSGYPVEVGDKIPPGGTIHKWDIPGNKWIEVGGTATRITVDKNSRPWVVNVAGAIFRRNDQNTDWVQLPGAARDIAASMKGTTWIIGSNPLQGGYGIFYWKSNTDPGGIGKASDAGQWVAVEGAAVRITVDQNGNPWVINSAGSIFRRQNNQWVSLPGLARDIAASPNGEVFVIGAGMANGSNIYQWNDGIRNWKTIGGVGRNIAVGSNPFRPFVTNDLGQIWQKSKP